LLLPPPPEATITIMNCSTCFTHRASYLFTFYNLTLPLPFASPITGRQAPVDPIHMLPLWQEGDQTRCEDADDDDDDSGEEGQPGEGNARENLVWNVKQVRCSSSSSSSISSIVMLRTLADPTDA
jgi:hypothetical protein